MKPKSLLTVVAALVVLVVALDSFFIVDETERAALKRFSEIVKPNLEPGIYYKVPVIDTVVRTDGRILTYDMDSQAFLTSQKKLLDVDAFVIWRIKNVKRYITTVGSAKGATASQSQFYAQKLLDPRVKEGLRNEFANRTVHDVVSGDRAEVMNAVAQRVDKKTREDLGIEVLDVRVKKVDWPEDVREQVFDRMRAERKRDAAEHRASGKEAAEEIRATAEKKRTVLLAKARQKAQKLRGEGDAKATRIYADSFSEDPQFFRFYRSLKAYRKSLGQSDDLMVMDPNSEFFRYLKDSDGQP